jgi:hypothetical protein
MDNGRRMSTKLSLPIGLVMGIAVGWGTLALGGHTDGAGRMGLALGTAV